MRPATIESARRDAVVLKGRRITRTEVLAAIAECDELGKAAFLDRYGYRDAVRFHLRHDGRSYPSKAILGRAARLPASEFFGGQRGAAGMLLRLGFPVRDSERGELLDHDLDALRRACVREGLDVVEKPWPEPPVMPVAYFASGSNRPGEIRGLARAGADLGVTAPELSERGARELLDLAGSDVQVFVDSGAFSEVRMGPGGPEVVRPIGPAQWRAVLALYRRLAARLGPQVWVVAPDRVGDQAVTLDRLATYRDELAAIAAAGARVLVPVQRGRDLQATFAARVREVLAGVEWLPALPCKKGASSPAEVRAFVRGARPDHVHLLGMGIRNRRLADYLAPFGELGCSATVSLDSCWIAANAGRSDARPRRFTRARDMARTVLGAACSSASRVAELAIYCCFSTGLANQ